MSKIQITKTTASKAKPDERALGFGKYYTDHMLIIDYTAGIGWHDARIVPFGNLPLHPAAVVLHYGMVCLLCQNCWPDCLIQTDLRF